MCTRPKMSRHKLAREETSLRKIRPKVTAPLLHLSADKSKVFSHVMDNCNKMCILQSILYLTKIASSQDYGALQ